MPLRDSVLIGLSGSTTIADATSVYFRYEGNVFSQDRSHAFTAGVRVVDWCSLATVCWRSRSTFW